MSEGAQPAGCPGGRHKVKNPNQELKLAPAGQKIVGMAPQMDALAVGHGPGQHIAPASYRHGGGHQPPWAGAPVQEVTGR